MKINKITALSLLLFIVGLATDCGRQSSGPKIRAENIWSRPAIVIDDEIGGVGVVYLTLINEGNAPDRLIGIETMVSEVVEIHGSKMEGTRVIMQPVKTGIEIPAKGQIRFSSGGTHIMLIGLKQDLKAGDRFDVILKFEKSGSITVESEVRH